jgi:hypothetical protein
MHKEDALRHILATGLLGVAHSAIHSSCGKPAASPYRDPLLAVMAPAIIR